MADQFYTYLSMLRFGDASQLLQAAVDAGGLVELPPTTLTLQRPVYLSPTVASRLVVRGHGAPSVLKVAGQFDALVVLPPGQRWYDPTPHLLPNPLTGGRWSFRTHGAAGLRFHGTIADAGPPGGDHWSAVRQFTVEFVVSRHGTAGGVCGIVWPTGGSSYRPAPWYVWQHPDYPEWLDFRLGLTTGEKLYRFEAGSPSAEPVKFRFCINLDSGAVLCERDGVLVTSVQTPLGPIAPGAVLADNPGAPLWLGGLSPVSGGACPPEFGSADVTFHTFRVWRTSTPPLADYDPWGWFDQTTAVVPFADSQRPVAGSPAVYFTGEQSAYAYLTPFGNPGDGWADGVAVDGVSFASDSQWGTGLSIASALNITLDRLRFSRFQTGLRVTGGPLPSYPVRVRDIWGEHQGDSLVRFSRSIVRRCDGVSAAYPVRSAIRADGCGELRISDVLHSGENAGPANTVTDCLRLDGCGDVSAGVWLSNYEDGEQGGPRNSYVRVTGQHPEPGMVQKIRLWDFGRQALRPGARFIDARGLAESADLEVDNVFGLPDDTFFDR